MSSTDLERIQSQNIRRRTTAAIEWRTIPPTIKVRHKKRPPPITVHSKRSFEQLVWTPSLTSNSTALTTATTSSSATIFTPFSSPPSTSTLSEEFPNSVGQEPRTLYYAIPGFQQSPNGPDDIKVSPWLPSTDRFYPQAGKTALEVVTELEYISSGGSGSQFGEVPTPPLSPSVYLTLHPWTLPEYLLLLSIQPLGKKDDNTRWEDIAGTFNTATRHELRSAWDCWHRWVVPWCRPQQPTEPRPNTYPHAPGVQHGYKFSDLEGLIDLWTSLSIAIGSPYETLAYPEPSIAMVQPRRAGGRAHHPEYPPPSAPPNVPARSLGNSRECGLAAWFTMSAINTTVLQRVLESHPERADDWLPVHLRTCSIPLPPCRLLGATPDSR
ncbi:hypothetical protein B0F90DRAFT_1821490 [Multifurca ochricompacta]|uniref:Myb-like domain-containing protein n=1 Tax=Multifurca ochricompacta TaxID=376703 RepID=A0AAD4QJ64_9AGAM|nr:hypothetical protein B0F90DRAFT_1821490 [Multifurca ochricompacta]